MRTMLSANRRNVFPPSDCNSVNKVILKAPSYFAPRTFRKSLRQDRPTTRVLVIGQRSRVLFKCATAATHCLTYSCQPGECFYRDISRKKAGLAAKSGTVGRAHIEIFLEVGPKQPTEINCVPKYTVEQRFGRGTVWYCCENRGSVTNYARAKTNPTSYKKRDISMI